MGLLAFWPVAATFGVTGCASHLQVPPADLADPAAVPPAAATSYLAATALLRHAELVQLLEPQLPATVRGSQSLGPARLSYSVGRSAPVHLYGDADGRLCVQQFLHGAGEAQMLGQNLSQRLQVQVLACARPVLDGPHSLRLGKPVVSVLLDRSGLTGVVGSLLDFVGSDVQRQAGQWAITALANVRVPTGDLTGPLLQRLQQPILLPMQACLQLRAQSVLIAQPIVTGQGLQMAVSVAAKPTVEQPCQPAPLPAATALPMAVTPQLVAPKTWLTLPVGVALETLRKPLEQALVTRGKVVMDGGWARVLSVQLQTSQGKLLARLDVQGEVQTSFLWIPWTKQVRGQVLVWGLPKVTPAGISIQDLQLDVRSSDDLVEWVAGLKRSELTQILQAQLKLDRRVLDAAGRSALSTYAKELDTGRLRLPLQVTTEELTLQQVEAKGQRLVAHLRFVGQIRVGAEPAASGRPPASR